jgi:ABC-2 type transport system ATP-binding protein
VLGHDVVSDYRAARRALGVVPQELVFDPFFTVRETLRIQSGYFGLHRNDDWIDEVMANLDLTGKADANMRALSGGMKRRVLVAQALVHRPPVIVLDEPTAGVDVELRQTLWQFVRGLNRKGHTVVLTTHYLEEAQELCARIAMLKGGRVIALDKTRNLLRQLSGLRMSMRVTGELPPSVATQLAERSGDHVVLRLAAIAELEPTLAALRQGGCAIEDLEVSHADLEDVFLQLMSEGRERIAA